MKTLSVLFISFVITVITVTGCRSTEPAEKPGHRVLTFSITQSRRVYESSDWGEPPQFAIWLEEPDTGEIRTVHVTWRSATGNWVGKVECPVALPYWVSRYNKQTKTAGPPTPKKPIVDALTGATPKAEHFTIETRIPAGSRWTYYIEVNVAGDFNVNFPAQKNDGTPDPQGNGQPSIIYRGSLQAAPGAKDGPRLIGRTEQFYPVDHIIADLAGITTAAELFTQINVTCK